jgi:hypothetical protein
MGRQEHAIGFPGDLHSRQRACWDVRSLRRGAARRGLGLQRKLLPGGWVVVTKDERQGDNMLAALALFCLILLTSNAHYNTLELKRS